MSEAETREALERVVADHPDDDEAWSVLADHLQDHGDALGQWIVRRAISTDDERAHALTDLRSAIEREVVSISWVHGVPHRARFDGSGAESPSEVIDALEVFRGLPITRLVRELELGVGVPREALAMIDGAGHLRVLDAMCIGSPPSYGDRRWGADGALELARGGLIRQLVKLDLGGHAIGRRGAEAIATAVAPALGELHLAGARIESTGISALWQSRTLGALELLDLHDNQLGDDGLAVLAALGEHPTLRELQLGMNRLTASGLRALTMSPAARSLEALVFFLDKLGDEGVAALVESPYLGKLRRLTLMSVGITDTGFERLASSELLAGLTVLEIGQNDATDRGVIALARTPAVASLTKLNLELMRGLTDDALVALAESPYLGNLQELWLWSDNLQRGVDALLASPVLSDVVKASIASQHPR